MQTSGIYRITNTISKKIYIGSSVNVKRRLRDHRRDLENGRHRCAHLQRSWLKHGPEAFVFEMVEVVEDKEQLLPREQAWMDEQRKSTELYNTCPIAGSPLGMKLTDDQRKKISVKLKGVPKSEAHRKASSVAAKARVRNIEEVQQFAKNRLGSKQTEEHKAKRNAATRTTKAKKTPEEKRIAREKYAATRGTHVTINGTTYLSLNEAEAVLGISKYRLKKLLA